MAYERLQSHLIGRQSYRGLISRFVLDSLRDAPEPVTTLELALMLLVGHGLDHKDQRLLRHTMDCIRIALSYQRDKGRVRSTQGPGRWVLWQIA